MAQPAGEKLDYDLARLILESIYAEAINSFLTEYVSPIPIATQRAASILFASPTQSY